MTNRLTDVERLTQCVLCLNDPDTCGKTDIDEDANRSCLYFINRLLAERKRSSEDAKEHEGKPCAMCPAESEGEE